VDYDLDGWLDLFVVNGHVYPEVDRWKSDTGYRQHPQLLKNLRNGMFQDVTASSGTALLRKEVGRGAAFGDLTNDGSTHVVLNNLDGPAVLLRCAPASDAQWLILKLRGTRTNRDGFGAKIYLRAGDLKQFQEVRQGGSFLASNDPRPHFGLGNYGKADEIRIEWPSGYVQTLRDVASRQIVTIVESVTASTAAGGVTPSPAK
jgi:hypothetical protein